MYTYHRISPTIDFVTLIRSLSSHMSYKTLTDEIRKRFIERYNFDDFMVLDSGRHALYLALWNTDRSKREVITPIFSCPIIPTVIKKAGKYPVYVDIDVNTFSIDFEDVKRKITRQTAAIIAVHEFGNPVCVEGLKELRESYDGIIIEDAAIALGSTYSDGSPIGQIGDFTMFSGALGKPVSANSWGAIGSRQRKINKGIVENEIRSSAHTFANIMALMILKQRSVYSLLYPIFSAKVRDDSIHFPEKIMLPSRLDNTLMLRNIDNIEGLHLARYKKGTKIIGTFKRFGIQTLDIHHGQLPIYSRIPFVSPEKGQCEKLIEIFRNHGIELRKPYHSHRASGNLTGFANFKKVTERVLAITVNDKMESSFFEELENVMRNYRDYVKKPS